MKKLTKILLSIPITIFCFLALADILSGGEPLIDEFIVLSLGVTWFIWLKTQFKPPKFLIAFLVFLISVVLHNVISHLLKFEEPIFFILSLFFLAASIILLAVFIIKKIEKFVHCFASSKG